MSLLPRNAHSAKVVHRVQAAEEQEAELRKALRDTEEKLRARIAALETEAAEYKTYAQAHARLAHASSSTPTHMLEQVSSMPPHFYTPSKACSQHRYDLASEDICAYACSCSGPVCQAHLLPLPWRAHSGIWQASSACGILNITSSAFFGLPWLMDAACQFGSSDQLHWVRLLHAALRCSSLLSNQLFLHSAPHRQRIPNKNKMLMQYSHYTINLLHAPAGQRQQHWRS